MMDEDDAVARADRARKGTPFLNTAQAAHYIGLTERTLEIMRKEGRGPAFRRHGRFVRYHIDDLDAWSGQSRTGRTPSPERPHG